MGDSERERSESASESEPGFLDRASLPPQPMRNRTERSLLSLRGSTNPSSPERPSNEPLTAGFHPECPAPKVPPPRGLRGYIIVAPYRAGSGVSNAPQAQNLRGTKESVVKINNILMPCFLKQIKLMQRELG